VKIFFYKAENEKIIKQQKLLKVGEKRTEQA
jgi:hypothetical protein